MLSLCRFLSVDEEGSVSVPKRTMWCVEKFLPTECPKCRKKFENNQSDWSLLLGDIVDGRKQIRETQGYDIITCSHCGNYTARVQLESYMLFDKAAAERLLGEGFVNLREVKTFGDVKESHTTSAKLPDIRVVKVERSEESLEG